ncbi:MAG: hypothetical protein BWY77_01691 [bacterium ADurb.Bin431]|nr:MAG: hypothetical protein BWY77_01691 [bacterium ADurb.Bin431]
MQLHAGHLLFHPPPVEEGGELVVLQLLGRGPDQDDLVPKGAPFEVLGKDVCVLFLIQGETGIVQDTHQGIGAEGAGRTAEIDHKGIGAGAREGLAADCKRLVSCSGQGIGADTGEQAGALHGECVIGAAAGLLVEDVVADETVGILHDIDQPQGGPALHQRRHRFEDVLVVGQAAASLEHHLARQHHPAAALHRCSQSDILLRAVDGRLGELDVKDDQSGTGRAEMVDYGLIIAARIR